MIDREDKVNFQMTKATLSNEREETRLSLRKKKLDEMLANKRYRKLYTATRLDVDENLIRMKLPQNFITEYDSYDNKIDLLIQFLNEDFSSLTSFGNYSSEDIVLFSLKQIRKFSSSEFDDDREQEIYYEENFSKLLEVYNAIVKLLNNKNFYILYECTFILISFSYASEKLSQKMISETLWKRLYEITLFEQLELTGNVIWIFNNTTQDEEVILRLFDTINFDKMYNKFLELCCDTTSKGDYNQVDYIEILNNIVFLTNILNLRPAYFVERLKFANSRIVSLLLNIVHNIILNPQEKEKTFQRETSVVEKIIHHLGKIAKHASSESDIKSDFYGEAFIFGILKYTRFLKGKMEDKASCEILNLIYIFFSNLISLGTNTENDLLSKHSFIQISSEILSATQDDLVISNVFFALSNFVCDSAEHAKDVISEFTISNFIVKYVKENSSKESSKKAIQEMTYVPYNAFFVGDSETRIDIIDFYIETLVYLINSFHNENKIVENSLVIIQESIEFYRGKGKMGVLNNLIKKLKTLGAIEYLERIQAENKDENILSISEEILKNLK